jgi:HEPN domain-containing protein
MVGEVMRFDASFAALTADAKRLDGVYIMTLYPDALAANLLPCDYFDRADAEACISSASSICEAARQTLRE